MTRAWRTLTVLILFVTLSGFAVSARQAAPVGAPPVQAGQAGPAPVVPQVPQIIERYTVGQARPPVTEGTELLELTLDQATAIALEKNLELKSARMNPILQDYALQTMRAQYQPSMTGSYAYTNSLTPSNNVLDGVPSVTSINQSYSAGVSQSIRWFGSPSVSVGFSSSRSSTNNVTTRFNPNYNAGLSFSGSMQLLQGFKIDGNRNSWRTFPITREIVDLQLLNTIESTKNSVRTSYWNLRSAIEQIEIARRSLEIQRKSWADSLIRVEIGTEASINTLTFETAVAQSEQSFLAAQIGWRQAELNFKRLLVSGTDDELYTKKTINPTDKPALSVQSVDIQAAVLRTLAEGTNIIIARKNLEVSRMTLEVTKGALLPQLSLSGGYNASGQGGTQHIGGNVIPGGYGDAIGILGRFTNPQWNMRFNISYPLGQLSQKSAYAQAQIRIDQSVAQLKAQELTVSTSVISAGLNVENAYKLYLASIKSREASEKNADAAQVRFDNGLLTNFEVVQAQNTLTSARLSELSRLIAYVNAIAEFERVQRIGG